MRSRRDGRSQIGIETESREKSASRSSSVRRAPESAPRRGAINIHAASTSIYEILDSDITLRG